MSNRLPRVLALAASVAAACVVSEGTAPTKPVPSEIVVVSGDRQNDTVGQRLSAPLVVRVSDSTKSAIADVSVQWQVVAGGGAVASPTTTTDAQGRASVTFTLGTRAGSNTDTVLARVGGLSVRFTASAVSGPAARLAMVAGDRQTAVVTHQLPQALVVETADQFGNPAAGVPVLWTITSGGGSLSAAAEVSDSLGRAVGMWTLGTSAGTDRDSARATAAGLSGSPVTFTASAIAATASQLVLVAGDGQRGPVAEPLAQPLRVAVQDPFANGVAGVLVPWTVVSGGGALSIDTGRTDAQGRAAVEWRLGQSAGNQHAAAAAGALSGSPVAFTATALAGAPSGIEAVSGDAQTGRVDSVLPVPLVARVRDSYGNPVSGVAVHWSVTAGGGTFFPADVSTDSLGVAAASLTLGRAAGTANNTAVATATGLSGSPLPFSASARAGPAARIAAAGGDGQVAPAATALAEYHAGVTDAYDNPIAGETVTWAVASGGGSITPAQATTDAAGLAHATRTLGPSAGGQTATAAATGLTGSPVVFTATATPNATISGTITLGAGSLAPPLPAAPTTTRNVLSGAYTSDELIVTLHPAAVSAPAPGSPAMASRATAATVGAAMRSRLTGIAAGDFTVAGVLPVILAARLRIQDTTRLVTVANRLAVDPAIATVERNALVYAEHPAHATGSSARGARAATLPNEPLYPPQAWHYGLVDLPTAWDITRGSAAVLVAVVDAGIRFDHPAVAANLTADGFDFVTNSSVPLCSGGSIGNAGDGGGADPDPTIPADYRLDPVRDCLQGLETSGAHGLHVAGTIGAVGNDGVGVTGVNWSVRIRPVRVLGVSGFGSLADVADGILYAAGLPVDTGSGPLVQAASAARIINMSLGGPSSTAESLAVVAAQNAGVLIVAAAGNAAASRPTYPAAYPGVLAVAAVGPSGTLASYSNQAGVSGVAAPGGDVGAGDGTYGVMSATWNFQTSTPAYDGTWQGTSMAAPHVSGIAALVLAQNPSLTASQLRSRLTAYAVDAGTAGADNRYGSGIVDARNSLTQSFAPPRRVFARLVSAATGATLQTVPAAADGSFAFTALPDGSYFVVAGEDENGDQQIGVPDVGRIARRWGAVGGAVTPAAVTVAGAGTYAASFTIALPSESEPNDLLASANVLVIGGYVHGAISSPTGDLDVFRVAIPSAGPYTFETSGWVGACGFALEEDTRIELLDSRGALVASNDDVDASSLRYCSRITAVLTSGSYYVTVGGRRGKTYRLQARAGP